MVKVLVVGQIPPPYGGQAAMIENLVRSRMRGVELRHLQMVLSTDSSQVAKFGWKKVFRLFPTIIRIIYARIVHRPQILYYAPAAPNRMSMFRDVAILGATRFLFPKTIFHFHAGGHCDLYDRLPNWQRWLFRRTYFHADAAIRLSELNPQDAKRLEARREFIVPNGIDDPCPDLALPPAAALTETTPLRLLSVGTVSESKGLMILIDACGRLSAMGVPFRLEIVGPPESDEFVARLRARVAELNLDHRVHFRGLLTGAEKFAAYAGSDVFCMPTFYECEGFPVVLLEAMAHGLPVVATCWRGIPSMVDDGTTGFLVEPRDANAVANRLAELARSPHTRQEMGAAGRGRFLREFTLSRHVDCMRRVFLDVAGKVSNVEIVASHDEWVAVARGDS